MGVHDLWSILSPVCESVPLYSLAGKTLAVDLSLWVCEAQHVQGMIGKVTKPHLRNLFFRVSSLTLMGVKLVFVMEGEAPKLKAETMKKRTDMRYGGFKKAISKSATAKTTTTKGTTRGRFNAVLRECAEMLDYLGVPWVTAAGEAEAMCAYLDSQGLVDGCITNDGDAFLYGAQTVYRNFNMNTKDPQVDCYKMARVQAELHLERETLVGLAILLGCDYIPKGIPGVGKELALKLIKSCQGQTILQKFQQWREDGVGVSGEGRKKVSHCLVCRHPGSAKAHERAGCVLCDSKHFCEPKDYDYQCPCDWHRYEQNYQTASVEASIRKKTLANDQFPFTEIINEFLIAKDKPVHHFKRRKPNMMLMQNFAHDKMEWPKHYTSSKVLLLMTYSELMNRRHGTETSSQIQPLQILKPRVRNAVSCFEVIWRKPDHYVFPEEHGEGSREEVRTVEEEALFRVAYPELVELYLAQKKTSKTSKKTKPKSKKEDPVDVCDGVSDLLSQMSLNGSTTGRNPQPPNHEPSPPTDRLLGPQRVPEPLLPSEPLLRPGEQAPPQATTKPLRTEVASPPTLTSSRKSPEKATSPSISTVMEVLHLSDIDWDAMSFTSSPTQPVTSARVADPKPVRTFQDDVERRERKTPQASTSDLRPAELEASEPCQSDVSLRDRVLQRNTFLSVKIIEPPNENVTKHVSSISKPVKIYSHNQGAKPTAMIHNKHLIDPKPVKKPLNDNKMAPLVDKDQTGTYKLNSVTSSQNLSKNTQPSSAQQTHSSKDNMSATCKPQHKYTFVKAAITSSSVPPQRSHSESCEGDKPSKVRHASKTSVCTSVRSSSEDSDLENHHPEPPRKTKHKPTSFNLAGYSLQPISLPSLTKVASETTPASEVVQVQRRCVPSQMKCRLVPRKPVAPADDDDAFTPIPGSPVIVSDDDDSVVCAESPLPLAERLRLKFLK